MVKQINAWEYALTKNPEGEPVSSVYENYQILKQNYAISYYDFNSKYKEDIETLLEQITDEDVLLYNDNIARGGGGPGVFLDVANWLQPVFTFVVKEGSSAIVGALIIKLATSAGARLIKIFNQAKREPARIPFLKFEGPNNSEVQFHFFYFLSEEDFLKAWNKIPETLDEVGFSENSGEILIYDGKQGKWFRIGLIDKTTY